MVSKSDIYEYIPLFGLFGWMVFTDQVIGVYLPTLKPIMGWMGIPFIFVLMLSIEFTYKMITSEYPFCDWVCPTWTDGKLRFYINRDRLDEKTMIDQPLGDGWYCTTLPLKWPIKNPKGEKIETQIHIHHKGLFADRIRFHPAKAIFAGNEIGHPAVSEAWVEELELEEKDIERVKAEPVFVLRRGNKDLVSSTVIEEYWREFVSKRKGKRRRGRPRKVEAPITMMDGDGKTEQVMVKPLDVSKAELLREIKRLEEANRELKRKYMKDHMQRLATEESTDLIKNELGAVLDIPTKVEASINRRILALWEYAGGIDNMVKLTRSQRISFGKYMAITILGLGALVLMYLNREQLPIILSWLSVFEHQLALIGIGIIVASVVYWVKKR